MVANMAGLGRSIDVAVVNDAVTAVLVCTMLPTVFACFLIVRLARLVVPR
jgi:hypothetical protein